MFKKEILFECSSEKEMDEKEKEIVSEEFIARLDTYNVKIGGQGSFDYINQNDLNGCETRSNKLNKARQKLTELMNDEDWKEEWKLKVRNGRDLFLLNNPDYTSPKPFLGKKHLQGSILKMQLSHKGKHNGKLNSQYGTCWITKDNINKKIKKTDLNSYLQSGWSAGRCVKLTSATLP